ncbi:GntR family transcriptional regulator [Sporosarcina sp. 179-K 8C2 HS]|uniref:GntR family transcriptional regulator n=1 Tax=Sporosarcina sp. 179-K 8C2 HS TaxID=3142387 RepID=UPI0039A2F59D
MTAPLNVMVYENIKRAIVEGDLTPGTRLTEAKVSEQMGVSTTPVREAFRRLSSEGLVKIIPWKGAIVQEFSEQELAEAYICREALEVLAIGLAIDHIDEVGIKKLHSLVADSNKATTSSSEFVEINSEIHNTIVEYPKNNTLANMLGQLSDVIYNNRNISAYSDKRRQEIYQEHLAIVQAIKEQDKEKAKEAMRNHVTNGYAYIQERLKKN